MNRELLIITASILLAGFLGTLIAKDPGYVLVSYRDYIIQTSLWILIFFLIASFIGLYCLMRSFSILVKGSAELRKWNRSRKTSRADVCARKGLLLFAEGNYGSSEKYLLKGTTDHPYPGLLYLFAAKAADAQKDSEKREFLLRKAVETDSQFSVAVAIVAAESANERGDWKGCLDHLTNIADNESVLTLKKDALLGGEDWRSLYSLLPSLRDSKLTDRDFEKRVILSYFRDEKIPDSDRKMLKRKLSSTFREDPEIVLQYVKSLSDEKTAEAALRKSITRGAWRSDYFLAYANLGRNTLSLRLKFVHTWLKNHGSNSDLHLALAKMYLISGDVGEAKQACLRSIELSPSKVALEMMARLVSEEGNHAESNKYFKQVLSLSNSPR